MIRTRIINGLCIYGKIPLFNRKYIDLQLFAKNRSFSDGITFFNLKFSLDLWKMKPCPKFEMQFTILNIYNHLIIHS
jgi:hypothetical protein